MCIVFFVSDRKTADEMRISDWSSDVCSSDLIAFQRAEAALQAGAQTLTNGTAVIARLCGPGGSVCKADPFSDSNFTGDSSLVAKIQTVSIAEFEINDNAAADRKSVV